MPAHVIEGLINFLGSNQELNASVWDGEVPRYDANGKPINPDSSVTPSNWPVVKLYMEEAGFNRNWNMADPYDDIGPITIKIWGTTRASVDALLDQIEAIFASESNWGQINISPSQPSTGSPGNPYYVIKMMLKSWTNVQEEEQRTADSFLLYRGELHYECEVHGAISTT